MAEIRIEEKTPAWLWISLAFVFLATVWFLFFLNDEKKTMETTKTAENNALIDAHENNSMVAAYVAFIDADNKMSLDHAYSSEALIKLTDAVEAMATEVGYATKVDVAKAKQYAVEITKDPLVDTHANSIRSAADLLSTALQDMQLAKYPELSSGATDVKNAAQAINPDILALKQQDAIKAFFKKTAELLSKMN